VLIASSRERVEEAVTLDGAPTIVGIRQYRKALEAELRHATSAHHLVALLALSSLTSEILLAHTRLALRALFCTCAAHPACEACVGSRVPLLPTANLRCMGLAREIFVVRLCPAAKARFQLALGALSQPIVPIVNLKAHVASRGRASVQIGRGGNRTADTSIVEAVNNILVQYALQVVIWNWFSAIWARDIHGTFGKACLCIPLDAAPAIPAVGACEPHRPTHWHINAAE